MRERRWRNVAVAPIVVSSRDHTETACLLSAGKIILRVGSTAVHFCLYRKTTDSFYEI